MAPYQVHYHGDVLALDMPSIPGNIQDRIVRAVEARLMTAPDRYGDRLRKSLSGLWRLRVGDYRVIYDIRGQNVRVWMVGHRKTAYEAVARRWTAPSPHGSRRT